ncbi:TonB-dependent receptor plug domain-containing protein [Pseudodesulfovibrio sp.]|uniref:TonB-dependent receptor plug domain-containing protein n=1 Tax=Pseudodesulfovibrio sp. TaxID=2035812 RepID=UPI002620BC40|nr:TonB-dependent receptor plug domain-containing protein [Pseudodesulfovibrio sp.]
MSIRRAMAAPGWILAAALALCCLLSPRAVRADEPDGSDIQELMDIRVTTASRRAEPLSRVAGAVTVLTEEDIFHSGATSLPELLRLAPGVQVSQMDTGMWAVGVRGFNGRLNSKHLVLIDGRPITSPATADVDWGKAVPIGLVKRVEVVRGTWTHLWGADSFTGVINVITKNAEETQGGQSVTLAGTTGAEQLVRYGGTMGDSGFYRAYVGGEYQTGNWVTGDGDGRGSTDWRRERAGVRMDWENAYTDAFSLQGAMVASSIRDNASGDHQVYQPHTRRNYNGYAQLVWDRATGLDSGLKARTSFTRDAVSVSDLSGGSNALDAELQQAVEQWGRHRFTWGAGSRYIWYDIENGDFASFEPRQRDSFTSNAFAQDRITLLDDTLYFILGTKLDYFGRGNVEFQPTARLLYTLDNSEYWLAVSRAVRADNEWIRSGGYVFDHHGTGFAVSPSSDLTTEKLVAYEAGYRQRLSNDLRWDVSLYSNRYSELAMLELDPVARTATLVNSLSGASYGMEAQVNWTVTPWLGLVPSVSTVYQDIYGLHSPPQGDSVPDRGLTTEWKTQILTKPLKDVGLDVLVGYLDGPSGQDSHPDYLLLEAHGSWKVSESLMLELIARNLGGSRRQYSTLRIGPSVDLRVTWNF